MQQSAVWAPGSSEMRHDSHNTDGGRYWAGDNGHSVDSVGPAPRHAAGAGTPAGAAGAAAAGSAIRWRFIAMPGGRGTVRPGLTSKRFPPLRLSQASFSWPCCRHRLVNHD
jgi:hypothetical protein